ncbi:PorP/SprF family type IX secretion system membrane protein [Neolewinella antarctica]|uniref:Type IX secretion system PorP/SprF family membrane protein n=1 Tax=Neolewinella antarctica TaxID=442734 RepID=A0ABX0X5Z3_9BACT|nr:PorP/SprF family type IX secretion system membrane protein [Neolewinella antarctica]NJC24624.1 type IX secretion system PorP/SprF family membrane protein [Neolewinella antarctica]
MKYYFLLFAASLMGATCVAQDHHFSQFFATPQALNPALTGLFQGRYRISLANRNQWGQVLETPFRTTAFSTDFHYYVNPKKRRYRDAFGAGVMFTSDRVSQFNYSVNQVMVGGAYHKSLDPRNNQTLSLGFQLGVVQRNVSYGELTFEDSFDGTSTYVDGASGEELVANNYAFGDYQIGLNYSYAPRNSTSYLIGAAVHHVAEPEQSFYAESTQGEDIEVKNVLDRRYSLYANVGIYVSQDITISPRIYAFAQGPHSLVNAGSTVRFLIDDSNGSALHLGAYLRGVGSDAGFGIDSGIAQVGIEIENFLVGLSYDVSKNGLQTNPRHRGAFELSIAYLGQGDDDDAVPCPTF